MTWFFLVYLFSLLYCLPTSCSFWFRESHQADTIESCSVAVCHPTHSCLSPFCFRLFWNCASPQKGHGRFQRWAGDGIVCNRYISPWGWPLVLCFPAGTVPIPFRPLRFDPDLHRTSGKIVKMIRTKWLLHPVTSRYVRYSVQLHAAPWCMGASFLPKFVFLCQVF